MSKFHLSFKVQDDLKELVHLIRTTKDRGGFFLLGVSGPGARKIIKKELSLRLKEEFILKKVKWKTGIKDLIELFPLEGPANSVYIVEELEKSLQEGDGAATYSLLNLTREFYLRNKKIVIYQLASDTLFKQLQWKAADFWSFRTASFDFFLEEDYRAIIKEKISAELEGYEKDSEKVVLLEDLLAKAKKEKKQDHKEISNLLAKLGNLYSHLGDTGKALNYLQQALELDRQLGYKQGEASVLSNIGLIYSDLGQPQKALNYLQNALDIFQKIKNKTKEKWILKEIEKIKKTNMKEDEKSTS